MPSNQPTFEFGRLAIASDIRDEYADHIAADDDARTKTVRFEGDTPDHVLDVVGAKAADSRTLKDKYGQLPVGDGFENVPHARSCKAIAVAEGVDNWLDYYDPQLSVDEHIQIYRNRSGDCPYGQRDDDNPREVDQTLAKGAKAPKVNRDRARDTLRERFDDIQAGECEQLLTDIADDFGVEWVENELDTIAADREAPAPTGGAPEPQPVASAEPEPEPTPAPNAEPDPEPAPAPDPEPTPAPAPQPTPTRERSGVLATVADLPEPLRSFAITVIVLLRYDPPTAPEPRAVADGGQQISLNQYNE